jgi:sugar/nucleoside kinase (ribokinase family)
MAVKNKFRISVTGCCLVDRLYNNISFSNPAIAHYFSKERADGGLTPGHLVFKEEFEDFCNEDFSKALKNITKDKEPDKINIGGPGIVPLIHASQMLYSTGSECRFYGCGGDDPDGKYIFSLLQKLGLPVTNYYLSGNITPSTIVLSDPDYDQGHGERIFINTIGAAWNYTPDKLDNDFFSSDIVIFGGTALVPEIHDNLSGLLEKAKSKGCMTVVNTVFDFRNEKLNPSKKWPLGKDDSSYRNIDLLITDYEEALRLSGKKELDEALNFFRSLGTKAVIVTNGPNNIKGFAVKNNRFKEEKNIDLPVSKAVSAELKKGCSGDTTGCGDNFTGGIIANLVTQLQQDKTSLDLNEACAWGIVSGGFSCFYMGGTYFESKPGEKLELITPFFEKYINQIDITK